MSYKDLINAASKEVKEYSVTEVKQLIKDTPESILIIDVRDIRELWKTGKIPNAYHAPRGMLEFWVDKESPYHKTLFDSEKQFIFYCAAGWRSVLAAKAAKDCGLNNVAHMQGGFTEWLEEGEESEAVIQKL